MDSEEDGRKREHDAHKKKFQSEYLAGICLSNQRISQNFKYLWLLLSYIVIPGRSHFLLREPSQKRVKFSDLNEIIVSHEQNDAENSELYNEVQKLKEKLKEFKMIRLENLKFREAIQKYEEERSTSLKMKN